MSRKYRQIDGQKTMKPLFKFSKRCLFIGFFPFFMAAAAGAGPSENFTGRAYDSSGELVYIEKHTVTYASGRVAESRTLYYDPDFKQIGSLVSDYSEGPRFGSYEFTDLRAGYQDGAEVLEDRIRLYRRETPEGDNQVRFLIRKPDQIVGQGFHQFIRTQLQAIAAGKVYHVKLVLPSRLDQFKFRIRKLKQEETVLSVRLEIDNWLLRIFAPHVDADYDLKTRQLLRYEGISNLADPSGNHSKVTINYSYPK
jgi:hypothetical protein